MRHSQEPAADAADAQADQRSVAELLDDEFCEAGMFALGAPAAQRDEKQQERHGQTVVETRLHVECLADLRRHARAVYNDLPQPRIRRREDGGEDARFPQRELRKDHQRTQGTKQNGQQHPRAQEAGRQVPNVLEHPEISAARVGEEQ